MAREYTMLTDEEVFALDEVLIRDNESMTHIEFDGGWGGAGNTNTTEFTEMYSGAKPLESFRGQKIPKPQDSASRSSPVIAAAVEDILYVFEDGNVRRLHLFERCTMRAGIAYDTYETHSVSSLSDKVVTVETEFGTYTGTVVRGLPEGKGVYCYNENDPQGRMKAEGFFVEGEIARYAKVTYRDGGVYEGSIGNGLPGSSGCTGKYIYPNGDYYIGGFKNGHFDYQGIIYDRTGKVICDAYWKEGEIAKLYKGELPENCRTGV